MKGSLHELEVKNARASQIAIYKAKLNARFSLQKNSSILAIDTLDKMKTIKRKASEDAIKKAKKAITIYENKAQTELYKQGVDACKVERACLQFITSQQAISALILEDK
jgi:hypothetical protein